jgi:hypothetical protein
MKVEVRQKHLGGRGCILDEVETSFPLLNDMATSKESDGGDIAIHETTTNPPRLLWFLSWKDQPQAAFASHPQSFGLRQGQ